MQIPGGASPRPPPQRDFNTNHCWRCGQAPRYSASEPGLTRGEHRPRRLPRETKSSESWRRASCRANGVVAHVQAGEQTSCRVADCDACGERASHGLPHGPRLALLGSARAGGGGGGAQARHAESPAKCPYTPFVSAPPSIMIASRWFSQVAAPLACAAARVSRSKPSLEAGGGMRLGPNGSHKQMQSCHLSVRANHVLCPPQNNDASWRQTGLARSPTAGTRGLQLPPAGSR